MIRRAVPLTLFALICSIYLLLVNSYWKPTWDSAIYITVSRALATGKGYTYMGYAHTKYPFMFPLLLAPITGLFGYNFLLMRLLIVLMGLGGIYLSFILIRKIAGTWIAMGVMILTAASYPFMFEATRILSDLPYAFFSFLAMILIERYAEEGNALNRAGLFASLSILTSYFTRSVGISLACATVFYLLLKGSREGDLKLNLRKSVLVGLAFLIPAVLWTLRNLLIPPDRLLPPILREGLGYVRELILVNPNDPYSKTIGFGDLIARLKRNVEYYEKLIATISSGREVVSSFGVHLISVSVLAGLLHRLIRQGTFAEYYFPIYMMIYLFWPSWQGERFLVPIIPLIFYYLLGAGELLLRVMGLIYSALKRSIKRNTAVWAGRALLTLTVLFGIWLNVDDDLGIIKRELARPYYTGTVADFLDVISWVKENTPPDAVIVSERPPWVYLLSGRKTFSFPWVPRPEEVIDFIRDIEADYVIATPVTYLTERYLLPAIGSRPDMFEEIYRKKGNVVYRVVR